MKTTVTYWSNFSKRKSFLHKKSVEITHKFEIVNEGNADKFSSVNHRMCGLTITFNVQPFFCCGLLKHPKTKSQTDAKLEWKQNFIKVPTSMCQFKPQIHFFLLKLRCYAEWFLITLITCQMMVFEPFWPNPTFDQAAKWEASCDV